MKYCGNYKHLIQSEWIEAILDTKGTPITPFHDYTEDPIKAKKLLEERYIKERLPTTNPTEEELYFTGPYNSNLIMAEIFTKENCPFDMHLKELDQYLIGDWWIVKQLPGQFMPIHRDTAKPVDNNHRYWFPWTDFQTGHIFLHRGQFINNYKAGDLFRYDHDDDLHGSANISLQPRIIMQISEHIIVK